MKIFVSASTSLKNSASWLAFFSNKIMNIGYIINGIALTYGAICINSQNQLQDGKVIRAPEVKNMAIISVLGLSSYATSGGLYLAEESLEYLAKKIDQTSDLIDNALDYATNLTHSAFY
ncbi:hypothetical protein NF27_DP01160 [Candidatus Jidaibacter acanthamoeba]|uniref:Uncharacterized protein n=1 Tax=Candidatus Jidaibacter acanthamoebae TaxID=86105 RepID=A0A0C1MU02_9RICK|nr:hypothetical protein [Candidatus Jidaibacter acanthamoeba]KIE05572.1 hypothetical protein NF27_DP01160 [Candidatus Jidaibacter acanthamoeba]